MTREMLSPKPEKKVSIPRKIGRAVCDLTLPTYITYPWRSRVRHSYPREDYDDKRAFWAGVAPSFVQVLSEAFGAGMLASASPGTGIRDTVLFLAGAHVAGKAIEGGAHLAERKIWERGNA